MTMKPQINRRSFVARIVGRTLIGGSAVAMLGGTVMARPRGRLVCNGDGDPHDAAHCADTDRMDLMYDSDQRDFRGVRGRGAAVREPTQTPNPPDNDRDARDDNRATRPRQWTRRYRGERER